jgi:hypothetical protein
MAAASVAVSDAAWTTYLHATLVVITGDAATTTTTTASVDAQSAHTAQPEQRESL